MPEFTAPELANNFTNTRLLANITDSSVMLQLYSNNISQSEHKDTVVNFNAEDVVFYNDITVQDVTSPLYNEPTVLDYISSGILSDIVIEPKGPDVAFSGISGSCHSITGSLKKQVSLSKEDHLELVYTVTPSNKLNILMYRDTTGISYSLDGGISTVATPTEGLLYPSEITSMAVQNSSFTNGIGNPKLWIGTLREGLKSYILGSTSWKSESDLEKTSEGVDGVSGKFLFRESLINPIWNDYILHPENYTGAGTVYRYIAGNYEPVYILGLINNPVSAGFPLVVYVQGHTQTSTGLDNDKKYLTKYLTATAPAFSLDPVYGMYRESIENIDTSWKAISPVTTNELVDVLKSVPLNSSQDVATTNTGVVTAISVFSNTAGKFITELLTITATNSIDFVERTINVINEPGLGSTVVIDANKFSGLSTFGNTLFITERNRVWRRYNNNWEIWLQADTSTGEKTTRIGSNFKFTNSDATSYISGFKGFGILKADFPHYYIGILNTDLGHLTFALTSTTDDFMSPVLGSKKLRKELFSTAVRDFQVIPEVNLAVSCGLKTEFASAYKIPLTGFSDPIRALLIAPKTQTNLYSPLSKSITSIFYKNYTHGDTGTPVLHNKYNVSTSFTFNTDQLYANTTRSDTVYLLKEVTERLRYVDNRSFEWLCYISGTATNDAEISRWVLRDYVTATTKYNKMSLLLRATEIVNLNDYILESEIETPVVLDFTHQILSTVTVYMHAGYVDPGYVLETV